jgi:hypothetical protein
MASTSWLILTISTLAALSVGSPAAAQPPPADLPELLAGIAECTRYCEMCLQKATDACPHPCAIKDFSCGETGNPEEPCDCSFFCFCIGCLDCPSGPKIV